MSFSITNRATKALYFTLHRAKQIHFLKEFEEVGQMKMKELLFYNKHVSEELKRMDATLLASRLDKEFTRVYKALYSDGGTSSSSILRMIVVLIISDATVERLSEVIDSCYQFRNEKNK